MRGKEKNHFRQIFTFGITPAYAGKSAVIGGRPCAGRDHPRICGEKSLKEAYGDLLMGSPPHMRGKGTLSIFPRSGTRITPAYAGKSVRDDFFSTADQDHPRICGEKAAILRAVWVPMGSPPHMRGKASGRSVRTGSERITPAYAGKRLKRSRSTVPPVAIVPLFPSVCNKPVVSDGSPAGRDAPLFLPAENAVPASPAYNLRSL